MSRADLLARLAAHKPWLESQGIVRLRVFGSYARDQADAESDIDLIADFSAPPTLLQLIAIEQALSKRLGCKVDLATSDGLKPRVRARIEAEAVDA